MQYKITYGDKEAIYDTLDAAKRAADEVFKVTGIIVGIEEA